MTLIPALALILLPHGAARHRGEAPQVRWLKDRYARLLRSIVRTPGRVLLIFGAALVFTLAALAFLGEEFLPHFKEYDFLMHGVEKPGTSLEAESRKRGEAIDGRRRRFKKSPPCLAARGRAR